MNQAMWGNPTLFQRAKYIENDIKKMQMLAKTIEKILTQLTQNWHIVN